MFTGIKSIAFGKFFLKFLLLYLVIHCCILDPNSLWCSVFPINFEETSNRNCSFCSVLMIPALNCGEDSSVIWCRTTSTAAAELVTLWKDIGHSSFILST